MKRKYVLPIIFAAIILVGMFKCPMYAYLGIPCPSCGMTRAWRLALGGHLADALRMHPLFWMPPLLLLPFFRRRWVIILMIILLLAVYAVRMVTMFPDAEPMNYNYDSLIGGFIR